MDVVENLYKYTMQDHGLYNELSCTQVIGSLKKTFQTWLQLHSRVVNVLCASQLLAFVRGEVN